MTLLRAMTILVLIVTALAAHGQALPPQTQTPTMQLRAALQSMVHEAGVQCPKMAAALEAEKGKHDANNYWFIKEYQNSLCQCQPAKVKVLLAQRPAAELDANVTQQQAMDYLMSNATAPCVGRVFRELLGGSQCRTYMDPAACACMAPDVAKMADMDILQSGIAYQEYREALGKAKAAGRPWPAVPPAAASLVKLTERCSKPER